MINALTAAMDSGSTILRKIVKWLAPSILADSTSSSGMVLKNCFSRNVPNAVNMPGRIRAQCVLYRPISRNRTKRGISIIWAGKIRVEI